MKNQLELMPVTAMVERIAFVEVQWDSLTDERKSFIDNWLVDEIGEMRLPKNSYREFTITQIHITEPAEEIGDYVMLKTTPARRCYGCKAIMPRGESDWCSACHEGHESCESFSSHDERAWGNHR